MTASQLSARLALLSAVSLFGMVGAQAQQQTAQPAAVNTGVEEIVVTAQRSAQSLQDVPIAVSAFTSENLERQQLNNTSQLQLALPNITFTKGNFTGANLTIRGIGSPAVATSGDAGVGIHYNDAPIQGPLIFETEFLDLERLEVLRGPQGTLFGRNATGGVMNFITAKPTNDLSVRVEGEYGNYNAFRGLGIINLPLGDKFAVRLAGQYIKRDGYTTNLYNNTKIDGRDQYSARLSLRFRPTDTTTIDLIGYYAGENSDRMRIQKQLCNSDPTAILGCSPDKLGNGYLNGNATLGNIIQSREFAAIALGAAALPFGNLSVYGPSQYTGLTNPADLRTVSTNFTPSYRTREKYVQAKLNQEFDTMTLAVTGSWQESNVTSRQDYNNVTGPGPGQNAALKALFPNVANRLYSGANYCISNASRLYSGIYGGATLGCFPDPTQYDQSNGSSRTWSVEGVLSSQFEGKFNFRIGAIYLENRSDSDYFVTSTGLDYGSGLLGALQSGGTRFNASPFFNSETQRFDLKSYGIFGEAYWQMTDTLKLTIGARYSNDKKRVQDRQRLFNALVPLGEANAGTILNDTVDADINTPGRQPFRDARLNSDAVTGRVVLDWKPEVSFTEDTLIYASYSRGSKPGGINPPFDPTLFSAPVTYLPEKVNAFEIGTKNRFAGGTFQANLTGFYYDYKNLQISRIINRTSFNDNTNAEVYGVEGEFIVAPTRNWQFNATASYLKTKVKDLSLVDVRDPSGGRADSVIIKDVTNAANCVVTPAATLPPGSAAAFVNGFNAAATGGLLRPAVAVPGTNAMGAFGICSAMGSAIAAQGLPFNITLPTGVNRVPTATGFVPITDPAILARTNLPSGNAVNLDGKELQNSPKWKFTAGAQYTAEMANDMSAVIRADLNFVGEQWGRNYNLPIDRIKAYETVNLSIQLNGREERWYVRAFVQNLFDNQGITGQYVTDPSSGLFTNIFTLEPRRFGGVVGVRF
ncbi:TonB-dependent receptor [Sandaracinobacteroides saxicola]|uniref:TonB-dependent receptor n=1 Tax=Sandaracinobacteroides saxicola TaxID=2759707 RepID=A0A7G5IGU9_9SPHN|nr:TonB-dependent receptor [Sandaracinobacteroides saxicola]QMW22591.1 TonB-dependent receptor [Sandaracinobacteroides saxicola]